MSLSFYYQTLHLYMYLHYLQLVGAYITHILVSFETNEINRGGTPKHPNPVVSICTARCIYFTPPISKCQVFYYGICFWRICKIAESNYQLLHVCLTVCPSVRLSVRKKQFGSHWSDFYKILYLNFFSKICRENSSLIKI